MSKEILNTIKITLEKQFDDKNYELQGVYEFTEDVYNEMLSTPAGNLEDFLKSAPRKKLH
jgi:hypothetical protein|tara:strand:- start:46 stop:225 length:180 start_codon:yes stop_codon:yes gene_type:complete